MTTPAKPLPDVHEPLTAPYWAGSRESRLVVPHCANCDYLEWPPEPLCPECQHTERVWVEIAPVGELWSFATYHQALDPAFANDIPYSVGLVELDVGAKMYGLLLNDENELEVGQRVRGVFEAVNDEVTFLRWRVDPEA
jgi:uncharacterized OB-fold protein